MESGAVWSRRLADELWSGPVTPLTFSLLADEIADSLARRRLAHAGLRSAAARPVFELAHGRVYVNAALIAEVMCELPSALVSEGLLSHLPEQLRERVRRGCRATLSPVVLATVARLTWHETRWLPWDRGTLFEDEAARVSRELAVPVELGLVGPAELMARLEALQRRLSGYLEVVSWGVIYAFVFFHLAASLLERWADGSQVLSTLLSGTPGIRTFAVHDELLGLAREARCEPRLHEQLLCGDAERLARRCALGEMGAFGEGFRAVLARHGHRLVGRDLACPTWRERPSAVVDMVSKLAAAGEVDDRETRCARGQAALAAVLDRVGRGPAGPLRRESFRRCFGWCQEYYALRENMRYYADMFLAAMRAVALATGDRLAAAGTIASREDVFYLTGAELRAAAGALAAGGGVSPELADRVLLRRAEYASQRIREAPQELAGVGVVEGIRPRPSGPRSLHGIGVSPGRAAGSARVVRCLEDLDELRRGEVVVAVSTDPSWTSLLSLGGAMVLEMGGMLCHGAIVARELGIPAVVDVAGATAAVRTGDRLRIDGAAGSVVVG